MEAKLKMQDDFDDFGTFTEPYSDDTPTYNFRALLAYCKEKKRASKRTERRRKRALSHELTESSTYTDKNCR